MNKKILILIVLLITTSFSYDRYLKNKTAYLCQIIDTDSSYNFDSYILDKFVMHMIDDIDFSDGTSLDDKEIISYHKKYLKKPSARDKVPTFRSQIPPDYFIVLKLNIKHDFKENTPTTFKIVGTPGFKERTFGTFTIGDDNKLYNQYYVKIKVYIYSAVTGDLYFTMQNKNDSHDENFEFDKEIRYNIDEVIEDFPDLFHDRESWNHYKRANTLN